MKKHLGKIIIVFVLLFMSLFGQSMEELLNLYANYLGVPVSEFSNLGISYSDIMMQALWSTLLSLLFTSVVMMAVPFIYSIVKKGSISYDSGKRLCKWNSVILFVLSLLLMPLIGTSLIGGVGAIIYYFINKWVFIDR